MINTYSEACERNRFPILTVIKPLLANDCSVLEIGSGTGQHAIFFAEQLPHITWQASDIALNLTISQNRLAEANLDNTPAPIELDVTQVQWPALLPVDTVFSANTAHIMHWDMVKALFSGVARTLTLKGKFLLYGPFKYQGVHTSPSNEQFDRSLKRLDPGMGIRDVEKLKELAKQSGMRLRNDFAMPSNNRILFWEKMS